MRLVELCIDQDPALLRFGPVLAHPVIVIGVPGEVPAETAADAGRHAVLAKNGA